MNTTITIRGDSSMELAAFVAQLAKDVHTTIQAKTPYRTGNARRNWTEKHTKNSAIIQNRVPYIERLEAGASRQAPKGMIGPTLTTIKGKYSK